MCFPYFVFVFYLKIAYFPDLTKRGIDAKEPNGKQEQAANQGTTIAMATKMSSWKRLWVPKVIFESHLHGLRNALLWHRYEHSFPFYNRNRCYNLENFNSVFVSCSSHTSAAFGFAFRNFSAHQQQSKSIWKSNWNVNNGNREKNNGDLEPCTHVRTRTHHCGWDGRRHGKKNRSITIKTTFSLQHQSEINAFVVDTILMFKNFTIQIHWLLLWPCISWYLVGVRQKVWQPNKKMKKRKKNKHKHSLMLNSKWNTKSALYMQYQFGCRLNMRNQKEKHPHTHMHTTFAGLNEKRIWIESFGTVCFWIAYFENCSPSTIK